MTKKHWKSLKWYCLEWDTNHRQMVWFNVLMDDLLDDITKAYKKKLLTNRNDLSKIVESWARYHYWCRAEHEVIVYDIFYKSEDDVGHKLDVFEQLKANWETFLDFIVGGLELDL